MVAPGAKKRSKTPPGQYAIPKPPVPSTPAHPRVSFSGAKKVLFPDIPPATPLSQPEAAPRRKSRIRSILIGSLLVLALLAGAIFIGLKFQQTLETQQNITPTPTPTTNPPPHHLTQPTSTFQ